MGFETNVTLNIGILLALACAVATQLGFLYKHRGSVEAPAVEFSRPISSSVALFRSPWYVLGIAVAMGSWGLHVAARARAGDASRSALAALRKAVAAEVDALDHRQMIVLGFAAVGNEVVHVRSVLENIVSSSLLVGGIGDATD